MDARGDEGRTKLLRLEEEWTNDGDESDFFDSSLSPNFALIRAKKLDMCFKWYCFVLFVD